MSVQELRLLDEEVKILRQLLVVKERLAALARGALDETPAVKGGRATAPTDG